MTPLEHAQQIIDFLNSLVALDSDAVEKLIETRVPCNQALAKHPTVQVAPTKEGSEVGLLGILNGFVGTNADGWGYIASEFDGDTKNLGHLIGFRLYRRH
jgi:hypothetical protein